MCWERFIMAHCVGESGLFQAMSLELFKINLRYFKQKFVMIQRV